MCSDDCPCGAAPKPALPRRAFLGQGAVGAIGALWATACGNRDIGGVYPSDPFPTIPFSIRISNYPQLVILGGMVKVQGPTGEPVAVIRSGATTFRALSMVCPHQGAVVEFSGSPAFRCPSHLAEFATDGTWVGGKETGDLTELGVSYDASGGTITIGGPVAPPAPPTIGIAPSTELFTAAQNGANPSELTVAITNTGAGNITGLGVVVGYGAGATSWLNATLDKTTAPATLTLRAITSGLNTGAYTATVQITSSSAANTPQSVSVSFLVTAPALPPAIAIATGVAFYSAIGGASPVAQNLAVTNGGGGELTRMSLGAIAYDATGSGWLAASLSAATVPTTLTLTPTLGALAVGTHTATVPIVAEGASNTPKTVAITFSVAAADAAPKIALSPASVSFAAVQGGTAAAAQTIVVQNAGAGALPVAVAPVVYGPGGSGWLTAVLSSPAAPATLTLTPTSTALQAGTYTATVSVTSTGSSNSPQTVAVTLVVAPGATIVTSPASLAFTAQLGTNPGGQAVNITSSAAALTGLAFTITYGPGAERWLSTTSLSSTTTPAALTVRAVTSALPAGTYTATIQISAGNAPVKTIAVTLVTIPAGLAVPIANWPSLAKVGGIAGSVGTVQGTPTAVVRTGQDSYAAYSMRCPHQGTTVRVEDYRSLGASFHCPNHNAVFDAAGNCLPNSPLRTSNLPQRSVSYTPGDTTLYIT